MHTAGAHPVHKATIVPRGGSLGMVMQLPEKDELSVTRKQLLAKLDVRGLGDRVERGMRDSFADLARVFRGTSRRCAWAAAWRRSSSSARRR